ncbi:extracellular solute-binding protein [Lentzea flava]|uniref:Sugar ABC transporter substrate-binding protein n=1 Tax=Lentzea flava TaxID=103732 RepID=A0ABQ2UFQ2_9PSEU|nr:extracellular solute-binding protein [Lentzea flava]MCP2197871.1 carbohydrate ABC transporter substrate-binding protein, CUT1 family (TC 3.A.1.1.-) [Lentzea flava]GGU23043.1 sugar ABC transporter substrate-binding protein [Lentzea flava]
MRRTTGFGLLAVCGLLAGCLGQSQEGDQARNADAKEITLTIVANAAEGGKNARGANWLRNWVIPKFTEQQKAKGVTATIRFEQNGTGDEDYKTKVALDLKTGGGGDIIEIDGIWLGEFAQAGQIKPLDEVVGDTGWDGWNQIPKAVQGLGEFDGKRYGVPMGTDGRVLFFNKKLFAQAGLPSDWQPKSWQDVLDAGARLKTLPGVYPIQLNAGTAMGEATTMQGVLPALAGTGKPIYDNGKWQGDSPGLKDVLGLYQKIYGGGLGDPVLQQEAGGRQRSFQLFSENKIGILLESDYFWRSVVEPKNGVAKMADRDTAVGWALVPARQPGAGVGGQDFVSMSGGGVRVINPNTKYPKQAWEFMKFLNSKEAVKESLAGTAQTTQRQDVNDEVLKGDPMLTFISEKVLPITRYRPGLANYPKVSAALQQATADVVAGRSPDEAARAYREALVKAVGEENVG